MSSTELATSRAHLGRIAHTRSFQLATGAGILAALAAGIAIGGATAILLLPLLAALAAIVVALKIADGRAHDDHWRVLGGELGLTFAGEVELECDVPILRAGDRRSCPEWLTGTLHDGRALGVGNYVFEIRHRGSDGSSTWHATELTLAVVELGAGVPVLSLRPRNVLRAFGEPTLPGRRKLERFATESDAFNDAFDLYRGADALLPARIFAPTFIEALMHRDVAFDLAPGLLAVWSDGRAEQARDLIRIRDLAELVLARVDAL